MNAAGKLRLFLAALVDVLWLVKRWVRRKGRRDAVRRIREFRRALGARDRAEVSRMLDDLVLQARGAGALRRFDRERHRLSR